jgi:hypothetical protein
MAKNPFAVAREVLGKPNAVRAGQKLAQSGAPVIKAFAPNIRTIERQEIEGVQEDTRVVVTRVQPPEIGHAIFAANDCLAVDQEPATRSRRAECMIQG